MYPKISIVTVSYNQVGFIEDNIRSVISQNYPNVEHIVIDAGSTDGTLEVLKKYSDHVRWTSEPDDGQSDGLNKGFRRATGDIIGWVNSDDLLTEGSLEVVAEYFKENSDQMALVGDQIIVNSDGSFKSLVKSRAYTFEYLVNHARGTTQNSLFFRRSVLEKTGYLDETLNYAMDRDLFIRIAKVQAIEYLPVALAKYRLQPLSKTSEGTYKFAIELIRIRRKYGGSMLSPANFNDLYIIVTQPFRGIPWLRSIVQSCRKWFSK